MRGHLRSYINQRHCNTVTHCLPAAMELTTFYLTNKTRNGYYQSRKFVTINKDSQTLTFGNIDQSSGVELKTCIVLDQKDWWTIKENRKDVDTEPSGKWFDLAQSHSSVGLDEWTSPEGHHYFLVKIKKQGKTLFTMSIFEYKELMKLVPAIDFYLYSVPYSNNAANAYSDDRW